MTYPTPLAPPAPALDPLVALVQTGIAIWMAAYPSDTRLPAAVAALTAFTTTRTRATGLALGDALRAAFVCGQAAQVVENDPTLPPLARLQAGAAARAWKGILAYIGAGLPTTFAAERRECLWRAQAALIEARLLGLLGGLITDPEVLL